MNRAPTSQQYADGSANAASSGKLRSVADIRRSTDDALLGGVSAGAARYFNLDPIVVRVIVFVASVLGAGGVVLYAAAWFVLPAEHRPSAAARIFRLSRLEPFIRSAALIVSAGIWLLSLLDTLFSPGNWGDSTWVWVPGALLIGVVVAFRRSNHAAKLDAAQTETGSQSNAYPTAPAAATGDTAEPANTEPMDDISATERITADHNPPPPGGPGRNNDGAYLPYPDPPKPGSSLLLLGLTASVIAIVLPVVYLVTGANDPLVYLTIALAAVGLALIVSTLWGDGGWLYAIGAGLTLLLAAGSLASMDLQSGDRRERPLTAELVQSEYDFDLGRFELDLTGVSNPEDLEGRTVTVATGVGSTVIYVDEETDVIVKSEIVGGDLNVLNERTSGLRAELSVMSGRSTKPKDALTLDVSHWLGSVEVIVI